MITSRRVALDGEQLDQVDDRIVIQGFEPRAGKDTFATATAYASPGQRVTAAHRDSMDIIVKFSVRLKKGHMAERTEIIDKANAWARLAYYGAWMTTNEREGQRIRVRIVQYPDPGDQRNWTGVYQFTFRAYAVPYWQDETPNVSRRANVQSQSLALGVGGNTETVMDLGFTNTSGGTINAVRVSTGSAMVAFAGLGLPSGKALVIGHTEKGKLTALCNGASCLAKITEDSSHDLWIEPGVANVAFSADGAGTLTISTTGRYV